MAENLVTDPGETPFEPRLSSDETHTRYEQANQHEQRGKLEKLLGVILPALGVIIVAYALVLGVLFLMGWTAAPLPFAQAEEGTEVTEVEPVASGIDISSWTDEELAAQMCMVQLGDDSAPTLDYWADQGVGSVVLAGNNLSVSLASDIAKAQNRVPHTVEMFIASNEEGGSNSTLDELCGKLLDAKSMSDLELSEIEQQTAAYGAQLASNGVNLVLGPVVDLEHSGGAITKASRTFKGDYDEVTEQAKAWAAGMDKAGVATMLKHWPGLGGYANVGSVVTSYRLWTEMERDEVAVFQQTSDGAPSMVLVTHVIIPDLTEAKTPASISHNALAYLRSSVGSDVIIVADDVEVLARSGISGSQELAAIDAIAAGADMVLYRADTSGQTNIIAALTQAIGSGTITRSDAEAKVARILQVKSNLDLANLK
jgi:beta-N-acetylhexosaminidase